MNTCMVRSLSAAIDIYFRIPSASEFAVLYFLKARVAALYSTLCFGVLCSLSLLLIMAEKKTQVRKASLDRDDSSQLPTTALREILSGGRGSHRLQYTKSPILAFTSPVL